MWTWWGVMLLAAVFAPSCASAADTRWLFQFFAFSTEDVELTPGPTMAIFGRVHANGDLYLNSNSTLAIGDAPALGITTVAVTAGGRIWRGQKTIQVTPRCGGTVTVDRLRDTVPPIGDLDPLAISCGPSVVPRMLPPDELALWAGSMADERPYLVVPSQAIITRDGPYWRHADLRIVLRADLPRPYPIEVQDADGAVDAARTAALQLFMHDAAWNRGDVAGKGPSSLPGTAPVFYTDVPSAAPGCGCAPGVPTCGHTDPACYDPPFGPPLGNDATRVYGGTMFDGDPRRGGFYDFRERAWLLLLNVNVADLLRWNADQQEPFFPSDDTTDGGIVLFLGVVGPDAAGRNGYGARVFGSGDVTLPGGGIGATPDPTGIAVVSDQALFVLGDFNRGPSPTVEHSRQPAALIGDTINVLSNRYWDAACVGTSCRDGQSPLSLIGPARGANNARINAAFLGGMDRTDATSGSGFNGGFQSFPRLHESWSLTTLTYRGSLVSLGPPAHKAGPWCGTGGSLTSGCNIYNPPGRNWRYDAGFEDPLALPPLTPMLGCGNGVVERDEECDDGNASNDDCCTAICTVTHANAGVVCRAAADPCDVAESCDGVSATCPPDAAVPDGTPCDDGDVCTLAGACTAGLCTPGPADSCDDADPCTQDACTASAGCTHDATPRATCRPAAASTFVLTRRDGASRALRWKWWRGASTSAAEFGDPTSATAVDLCVYDADGIALRAHVPPGTPRWRSAGAGGHRYRDGTASADGVTKLHLVASDRDRAQIALTGKGALLSDPPSGPLLPPLTVQLRRDDAPICWTASFAADHVVRNDEVQTKAQTPR